MNAIDYFKQNKIKCLRYIFKYKELYPAKFVYYMNDNDKLIIYIAIRSYHKCCNDKHCELPRITRFKYCFEKIYNFKDIDIQTSYFTLKNGISLKMNYQFLYIESFDNEKDIIVNYLSHEILSPKRNMLLNCKKYINIKFLFI